jgi:predicted metallopeptidase
MLHYRVILHTLHFGVEFSGSTRKLYSEVTSASIEKRYKLLVKLKSNESPETIKNVLKTNINPIEMKVGIKTLMSLKD